MEQASAQGATPTAGMATPTAGMAAPPSSAWWQSDKQYCVVGGAGQISREDATENASSGTPGTTCRRDP